MAWGGVVLVGSRNETRVRLNSFPVLFAGACARSRCQRRARQHHRVPPAAHLHRVSGDHCRGTFSPSNLASRPNALESNLADATTRTKSCNTYTCSRIVWRSPAGRCREDMTPGVPPRRPRSRFSREPTTDETSNQASYTRSQSYVRSSFSLYGIDANASHGLPM